MYLVGSKYQGISHILAGFLVAMLAVPSFAFPALVFAEEGGEEPVVSETQETSPIEEAPVEAPTEDPGASIETGDAVAMTEINNEVNTNITDTAATDETEEQSPEETVAEEDSGEPEVTTEEEGSGDEEAVSQEESQESEELSLETPAVEATTDGGSASVDIVVETENNATVTTETETTADTGDNTATGSGGGAASVTTGTAIATTNVLNVVNTTVTDSTGLILLLNSLFGGQIDLSGAFTSVFLDGDSNIPTGDGCSLSGCDSSGVEYSVTSTSTAEVTNSVVVRADTGSNSANADGGAAVQTGNAFAGANVVTVANTNIVHSNYLLISLNSLGGLFGDVVLPGKLFFEQLLANASSGVSSSDLTVSNTNEATVENMVSTIADTGSNTAVGGGASIITGDAGASTAVLNQVNTNLVGGTSLRILVRVAGGWNGTVFSLPEGLSWHEMSGGIEIFNTAGTGGAQALPSSTLVANNNSALVNNNVSVTALTGDNYAGGGSASITTGNAQAAASVTNVVNTNVVGQNWILAILNLAGGWSGNLAFGQPDLWVGVSATPGEVVTNTPITYTVTVANMGNADATDVVLTGEYRVPAMIVNSDDNSIPGRAVWDLGTIPAGSVQEYTYEASTSDNLQYGTLELPFTVTATEYETDANDADNTDSVSILGTGFVIGQGTPIMLTEDANLHVTKIASTGHITAPGAVDYTITVTNSGGPAYNAVLYDTVTDEDGNVVGDNAWNLDTVAPNDEITVTYTAQFKENTHPGLYTGSAQVLAISRSPIMNPFYGWFTDSPVVTTSLVIDAAAVPVEVVASTPEPNVCRAYLTSYLGTGQVNDSEQVQKLQEFLQDHGSPSLAVTGEYDDATRLAVSAFQEVNRETVLTPWGITNGTGTVYYTTRQLINSMMCDDGTTFQLSKLQKAEIERFKNRYVHLPEGYPVPDTSTVGLLEPGVVTPRSDTTTLPTTQLAAAATALPATGGIIAPIHSVIDVFINMFRTLFAHISTPVAEAIAQ